MLRFYDLNEAAYAYHRHCLDASAPIDPTFLKTLEYVADELYAEARRTSTNMKPEYIKKKILDRRYTIQYSLDQTNMKNGCNTQATASAKAHYEEFSRYKKAEIRQFIAQQTQTH